MLDVRTLRLLAGYGAIASAVPYLALKIVWLSGGSLGATNADIMRDPSLIVLNAITAGMDLVGIGLALAFTHGWGSRIPSWLLLPPMWVATGLLARFVVGVPLAAIIAALMPSGSARVVSGPMQPWVYVLVYSEFAGLGIGLMVSFFLYARIRWTDVLTLPSGSCRAGASLDVHVVLANATAPVALALGLLFVWRAFSAPTVSGALVSGIDGALMVGAAVGVLTMVHGLSARVPWLPLTLAWIGSGSLFGWGLWQTVNVLGQTALVRFIGPPVFVNLVGLLRMIVGLVLGLLILFLIAHRRANASRPIRVERQNPATHNF